MPGESVNGRAAGAWRSLWSHTVESEKQRGRAWDSDAPATTGLSIEKLAPFRLGLRWDGRALDHTFPSFAFIEPKYFGADQNDDHPPHNVFKAEKLIPDVYNAIRSSPDLWVSTLLVILYDEHGGFYDHVSPPPAIPPDDHHEEWTFDRLGVRVPAILVSPWVGARVEPMQFDHTSLLKYLTDKWGLGSLGRRTAAANSIGVALNQTQPREDTAPFIRVSYTTLIPKNPDLEEDDRSKHHESLHAFAAYLAETADQTMAVAIRDLARAAGLWVRLKAVLGKALLVLSRWLSRDLRNINKHRVDATTQVAARLLDRAAPAAQPTRAGGPT